MELSEQTIIADTFSFLNEEWIITNLERKFKDNSSEELKRFLTTNPDVDPEDPDLLSNVVFRFDESECVRIENIWLSEEAMHLERKVTFDEFAISELLKDETKINEVLQKVIWEATSKEALQIKMEVYQEQIEEVRRKLLNFRYHGLTNKFVEHITRLLEKAEEITRKYVKAKQQDLPVAKQLQDAPAKSQPQVNIQDIVVATKDPQHLFTGLLTSLIFSYNYEAWLKEFRTPYDLCVAEKPCMYYDFNEERDIRIIYQDEGDRVFYPVEQTFDDFFIQWISLEKFNILDSLNKIVYDSVSYDSLEIRMNYYLKEISRFPTPWRPNNWNPLTQKAFSYVDDTVQEIKNFILAQLCLKGESTIPSTKLSQSNLEKQPPELIISPWAVRNVARIKKLYKELKKTFIKDEIDRSATFAKILCGETYPCKEDRIRWDNQRALKYFIATLETLKFTAATADRGKLVFTLPKDKWKLVKECFVKQDGGEFDHISTDSKPLAEDQRKKIDNILGNLNL